MYINFFGKRISKSVSRAEKDGKMNGFACLPKNTDDEEMVESVITCLMKLDLTDEIYTRDYGNVDLKTYIVHARRDCIPLLFELEKRGKDIGSWVPFIKMAFDDSPDAETNSYIIERNLDDVVSGSVTLQQSLRENAVDIAVSVQKVNWKNIAVMDHKWGENGERVHFFSAYPIIMKHREDFDNQRSTYMGRDFKVGLLLNVIDTAGEEGIEFVFENHREIFDRLVEERPQLLNRSQRIDPEARQRKINEMISRLQSREGLFDSGLLTSVKEYPEVYSRKDVFLSLFHGYVEMSGYRRYFDINDIATMIGFPTVAQWLKEEFNEPKEDDDDDEKWRALENLNDLIFLPFVVAAIRSDPEFAEKVIVANTGPYILPDIIKTFLNGDALLFVERYVRHFNTMNMLYWYISNERPEHDELFQFVAIESIKQGYGLSGSTTFEAFIKEFRETWGEWRTEEQRKRATEVLSYFNDYYKDVGEIVQHSTNYAPDALDTLYMYAHSSAVFNEPFKEATYTETQKKLQAARRRPTAVQAQFISQLDDLFRNAVKTTTGIFAWRGIGVPEFAKMDLNLDIFKSLSLSIDVSKSYLRGQTCCLIRVFVPPGTPLIAIDPVQGYKNSGGLFEYVLPRSAIFSHVGTSPSFIEGMTIYNVLVEIPQELDKNLYVGRLRPKRKLESEYRQDTHDPQILYRWRETMLSSIYKSIKDKEIWIKRKMTDATLPTEEKWKIIEERLLNIVKIWRAKELANNTYIGDEFIESQLPGLRLQLLPLVLTLINDHEGYEEVANEISDYVVQLNTGESAQAVKRAKRLR